MAETRYQGEDIGFRITLSVDEGQPPVTLHDLVRVTACVFTDEECRVLFGVDLTADAPQPLEGMRPLTPLDDTTLYGRLTSEDTRLLDAGTVSIAVSTEDKQLITRTTQEKLQIKLKETPISDQAL